MAESTGSSRVSPVSGLALLLAIVAVGLAIWGLVRSPSEKPAASASFATAQSDDPKGSICKAFDIVRRGVQINTNLQPPGGQEDVTGSMAVAANARLSLYDGGQYLLARLEPETPSDLADAVRGFANNLMDIGARSTSGIPNSDPDQAARLKEADASNTKITELCK